MRRSITDDLLEWRENGSRKALMIMGERQVGKTFIIRRFGEQSYEHFLELNFLENPSYKAIFDPDGGTDGIIDAIKVRFPRFRMEGHGSLLFLDEVQECPEALTALKFLCERGLFDIIVSGSMLGVAFRPPRSYPVGYVTHLTMHPMSFEEFLLAQGVDPSVPAMIREHIRDRRPFGKALLQSIQTWFRSYMIVGGMPECVLDHALGGDINSTLRIQGDLVESYRRDIKAYAPMGERTKVDREFDLIPVQLGRRNKRVMFNDLGGDNAGMRGYASSLGWIVGSGMVNPCHNLNAVEPPLREHAVPNLVKLYQNDTGLLMSMMGRGTTIALMEGDVSVNEGAIAENIVCQMLVYCGLETYYFDLNKEGRPRMEVDFVTMLGTEIAAIEVKSGKNRRATSINKLRTTDYGSRVSRFIKLYSGDITTPEEDPDFEHYPMFCAAFADALIRG